MSSKDSQKKVAIGSKAWINVNLMSDPMVMGMMERWTKRVETTSTLVWVWTILAFAGIGVLTLLTSHMLYLLLTIPVLVVINIMRDLGTIMEVNSQNFLQTHNTNKLLERRLAFEVERIKQKDMQRLRSELGNE